MSRILSLDVECVADGKGHNDRVPCWVAVVDEKGTVLLDQKILVPKMVSPLTEITGITQRMLVAEGRAKEDVFKAVHDLLGADVTLVGQVIGGDCDWLDLVQGVHYSKLVDLAEEFKCWNTKYKSFNRFSLAQTVHGLLSKRSFQSSSHNPSEDAKCSMQLYREWIKPGKAQSGAKKLNQMKIQRKFPPVNRPTTIDGVCMLAFRPNECTCGQPTKKK
eukprot:m.33117 g.33117  ORF g.33117 m.33117 type:complete len:218 (-) comp16761_c0_seq2:289-942(-)